MVSWPASTNWPGSTSWPDGAGPPASTPLTILGADCLTWLDSRDATVSLGVATAWVDRIIGAATLVASPTASVDGTLGIQTVNCDGVAQAIQQTKDRPAPSAGTPTTLIMIMKQNSWTSADSLWGTGANVLCANQVTATPGFVLRNTTAGPLNSSLALSTWKMVVAQYSNETTDFSQVGQAAKVTGTALGASDPGATMTWGARTLASFAHTSWQTMIMCSRKLTVPDTTALIAYFNTYLPASVTT